MKRVSLFLSALIFLVIAVACGGAPKKSRCDVKVFSPEKRYSEAVLLDTKGVVIDSTLRVCNDSIIFFRTDTASMPYVATLKLRNPNDSLDDLSMPIVIEGGTVSLELADVISLSGTSDNDALFKFLKAKNSYMAKLYKDNDDHDLEKLKKDNSKFFADQILLNQGTIVGEYIMQTYQQLLSREDYLRIKERMKK